MEQKYKKLCVSLKIKNVEFLDKISKKVGVPKSVIIQKILDKFEDNELNVVDFYK